MVVVVGVLSVPAPSTVRVMLQRGHVPVTQGSQGPTVTPVKMRGWCTHGVKSARVTLLDLSRGVPTVPAR